MLINKGDNRLQLSVKNATRGLLVNGFISRWLHYSLSSWMEIIRRISYVKEKLMTTVPYATLLFAVLFVLNARDVNPVKIIASIIPFPIT